MGMGAWRHHRLARPRPPIPIRCTGTVGWGSMSQQPDRDRRQGQRRSPTWPRASSRRDGAKKWVFKLRKGATFHNGKTVTADDVVASFRHHMGKDSKSAAKSLARCRSPTSRPTATTVVFKLAGGNADFPYIASDYHIPIMPAKDDGTVDWQSGIRTGPYMLEKFEPGVSRNHEAQSELLQSRQALVRRGRTPPSSPMSRRAPTR